MSEPAVLTEAELEALATLAIERSKKGWVSITPAQLASLVAGCRRASGATPWPHHFPLEGA